MSNLKKYDLLELPWTDVADYLKAGNDVVMIPVGSCEKHGSHVPLGVDSYTTMGSVERAAAKAKVLYAPLLPFGLSPHHMGEAGLGNRQNFPSRRGLPGCSLCHRSEPDLRRFQQAGLRLSPRHQHGSPGGGAAHAPGRDGLLLCLLQDSHGAGLCRCGRSHDGSS